MDPGVWSRLLAAAGSSSRSGCSGLPGMLQPSRGKVGARPTSKMQDANAPPFLYSTVKTVLWRINSQWFCCTSMHAPPPAACPPGTQPLSHSSCTPAALDNAPRSNVMLINQLCTLPAHEVFPWWMKKADVGYPKLFLERNVQFSCTKQADLSSSSLG